MVSEAVTSGMNQTTSNHAMHNAAELNRIHEVLLDMLIDITQVCDGNDIDYFLDGGTLLGAVRHQGFIPWDDDLDIGMTRQNYERFLEVAQAELGEKYFVQTWHTDNDYGLWFAKVRLVDSVYEEAGSPDAGIHKGFFIDIFPYDPFPVKKRVAKNLVIRTEIAKRLIIAKCGYKPWANVNGSLIKKLAYGVMRMVVRPLSREWLINHYERLHHYEEHMGEGLLYPQGNSRCGAFVAQRTLLEDLMLMPFEGRQFKAPRAYDLFLRTLYGDWQTLPPESDRVNRHRIKRIRFPESSK